MFQILNRRHVNNQKSSCNCTNLTLIVLLNSFQSCTFQETLHPNSPTPLSAERCDSSLSNVDVCRICQCDSCEIQKESPLVAPCLCSGSLKFVHQACLQKWIKSSDKLSCELCMFEYKMTKKTKPFREVVTFWFIICCGLLYPQQIKYFGGYIGITLFVRLSVHVCVCPYFS